VCVFACAFSAFVCVGVTFERDNSYNTISATYDIVCVCVRERESVSKRESECVCVYVSVGFCVCGV